MKKLIKKQTNMGYRLMTEPVVLDSSAILAVIFDEPGTHKVIPYLPWACVSSINRTETLNIIARKSGCSSVEEAKKWYEPLEIETISVDQVQSDVATELNIHSRKLGLSIGDCICLALGKTKTFPIFTADKAWAELDLGLDIRIIR